LNTSSASQPSGMPMLWKRNRNIVAMDPVAKLNSLNLHDSSVNQLSFSFEKDKISLAFSKSAGNQIITFQGVKSIVLQDAADFILTEIYRLNCS
jgi:hypothetical protein